MLAYSMSNIWYTLFVCMCLYCVSWWCCLGTRHLNGSWSLTAQGYMLDWLGDVTSTVSFCQLSGGCVTQQIYAWIAGFIWAYIRPMMCVNYAFCILYCFWVIFCPRILSLSFVSCINYNIFPYILESVYWFHSKTPLHMCLFGVVPVTLSSRISQWIICHIWSVQYVVSYANHFHMAGIDLL